jgi:aryl-alcohol dehydrogenase-like predicted oxidoreductase
MRALGVGLVPYSPLGRGFLTGTVASAALGVTDVRAAYPRFTGAAEHANQRINDAIRTVADTNGATPAQVALAWVHGSAERLGVPVVPIPGTKRVRWLEDNVAAFDISLSVCARDSLDDIGTRVIGARY